MARQSEVTAWILKNQNALDLQVTKLTWIDRVLPGYVDLSVRLKVGKHQTEGRGTDASEEVALGKAVCEAIERLFCIERGIQSTGLAGHISFELAKKEALKEFIERATLAQHLSTGSLFEIISEKPVQFSLLGQNIEGLAFQFRLISPAGYETALVMYEATNSKQPFGGVLGIGCEINYEEALKKAEIEALRSIAALAKIPITPLTYEEFQKTDPKRGEHRKRLLMDADYCRKLINKIKSFTKKMNPISIENLSFENMGHPVDLPSGCPLHFVRCQGTPTLDESSLEFVG